MRSLILTVAAAAVAALPALAHANDRYVPRPPVLLSPDLSEPWLLQYVPKKKKVVMTDKVMRRAPAPTVVSSITPVPVPQRQQAQKGQKQSRQFDPAFLPAMVAYSGPEKPGTIVIDTNARYLYLVEAGGQARRYGVGVGKPGFEWAGEHRITRKAEWPGWTPPPEMRKRRPGLPVHMVGGPDNPLGARAMYLGSTLYRIHGSNEPWSIGKAVSSGCIRMRNEDVTDLYERVGVGTRVIVM
ncbi:L,D-transpeptidase [Kaistia geumhonensis]|uniref:Lipoprotein-anchoring transpeptidase ErfK/SrfK n=1 Tax=Kaistia geumhonensis TaxID=410839 RepID=A0ABU0M499_9HYPH|nr:L,D-transpeptidase [Kaistia geumhonensis]MCX5479006.1 L,D-transpeptidase [Kaistia geumhonensis]MDQ0515774.1 lipoprotein-anchoring transpeptidase ErfK/SrfK [Kaistia geumhonensis]